MFEIVLLGLNLDNIVKIPQNENAVLIPDLEDVRRFQ
jgi:hypothetical protein